jgi:hypothetical protein
MTPTEYLDPARFPLTTQAGLDIERQMMIDAFNLDGGRRMVEEEGYQLTPEDEARKAELETKVAAHPDLRRQLKAARGQ